MVSSFQSFQVLLGHQPVLEPGDVVELLPSVGPVPCTAWTVLDGLLALADVGDLGGSEPRRCRQRSTHLNSRKPWQLSSCCLHRSGGCSDYVVMQSTPIS